MIAKIILYASGYWVLSWVWSTLDHPVIFALTPRPYEAGPVGTSIVVVVYAWGFVYRPARWAWRRWA
jgi:hypothetical protein